MKYILQILTLIFLAVLIQSCATFPKSSTNQLRLTEHNLTRINGKYKVKPVKDSLLAKDLTVYHNAFEKFYRGKGRSSKDTMKVDNLDNYTFEIRLIENNQIEITYLKDKISFRNFKLKYELKRDGYLYLKNKNLKVSGVPYLFGSIDIKKLRLNIIDNYLTVEEIRHSSGAILFIFGDSKTWHNTDKYGRTE